MVVPWPELRSALQSLQDPLLGGLSDSQIDDIVARVGSEARDAVVAHDLGEVEIADSGGRGSIRGHIAILVLTHRPDVLYVGFLRMDDSEASLDLVRTLVTYVPAEYRHK
jgi:hypothetical protein